MGYECGFYKLPKIRQLSMNNDMIDEHALIDFFCSSGRDLTNIIKKCLDENIDGEVELSKEDLVGIQNLLVKDLIENFEAIRLKAVSGLWYNSEDCNDFSGIPIDVAVLKDDSSRYYTISSDEDDKYAFLIGTDDKDPLITISYLRVIQDCLNNVDFENEDLFFYVSW